MKSNFKFIHHKSLYNFFLLLSLIIFFFSTAKVQGKAFEIDNIDISKPFEIDFNKNEVISDGFQKAFFELISLIVSSSDRKKISQTKLNEIKGMIDSFSIKEEKFVDEVYYVNLGVSFNRKKVFNFLEKKNIFPSIPLRKKLLFIPIIIDENKKDLLIFSNNKIFNAWNKDREKFHLIEYIMPTEDLEDLNLIKSKYDFIEQYDFKEIIDKYYLNDSIITLIFKNEKETRVLSRIIFKENVILKNKSFLKLDINNEDQLKNMINDLKIIYEDSWKSSNQINTSIKLPLNVMIDNIDQSRISSFEKILNNTDLVYDFYISKFDKDFTYYQIIFNGTPSIFLKTMKDNAFIFDTQNKVWILR